MSTAPSLRKAPRWADPTTDVAVIDGLRVATLGEQRARRQALMFMGFLACVEPFELQRFALLAAAWDAQLTVVDTPGCGYGGGRLSRDERAELRRGDFTAVAHRMVRVAQRHHERLRRGSVTVVGYSMGCSLACAAAADPGLLRVTDMVLVEPVATRRWNLASLILCVRSEDRALDACLDHNNAVPDVVLPRERRGDPLPRLSRVDLAHLGFALSRGRLTRDLLSANAIQRSTVQVVHGTDSTLSRAGDVRRLARICRRFGAEVCDLPVTGQHALWHSLPDVAALAEAARNKWPQ